MFSNEAASLLGVGELHSCSFGDFPSRRPLAASPHPKDYDPSASCSHCSLALSLRDLPRQLKHLRNGRLRARQHRVHRRLLKWVKEESFPDVQGSSEAWNWVEFLTPREDGGVTRLQAVSVGSRLADQLPSIQCEGASLTEVKEEEDRYLHTSSEEINEEERDKLRALIDTEEIGEDQAKQTLVSASKAKQEFKGTETPGRASELLLTGIAEDLTKIAPESTALILKPDVHVTPDLAIEEVSKAVDSQRMFNSGSPAQDDVGSQEFTQSTEHENSTSSINFTGFRERGGRRRSLSWMGSAANSEERLAGIVSALERALTREDIEKVMLPDLQLSSSDFNIILNSVRNQDRVLEFFSWMKENGKTVSNLAAYNTAFKVLGSRQEWNLIESLLGEMKASCQCEANCQTFNTLIHACFAASSAPWATKWFHLMIEKGVQPNNVTYSLLMTIYQKSEKFQEAEFVFQHMERRGCKCPKAYSKLIALYSHSRQYEKAEDVANKMKENDVKPEKEHWSLLMNAYVKQGKVQAADEVMQRMQQSQIRPDVFAYNSMITVNGKANHFKGAMDWFRKLEEGGLQPDAVTYRSLIGACGRAGKLKEALKFYERMKLQGFRPSVHNFNTLIHLHRKVGNDERILHILSDMKDMGCCPDVSTLDAIVKVYERYGKLQKIPQALRLLQEAGWSPDEKCYGILIRAYIRCSWLEQALDAFNYLCNARGKLGESLCHHLICLCKDAGLYKEAVHVFLEMQKSGTNPSLRTSCTIIDIYGLMGAIEEGEVLFEKLRTSGQKLDSVAYNVTINLYLRAGLVNEAAEVLKLVNKQEGLQPDAYLFLSMLRVYQKCGMHQDAVKVYWWMVKSNLTWTEALYNGVIHCCGRALPLEQISKVFLAMVHAKIPVNNVTCNVMIDIFGKAGLLEHADTVLRMAQKQGVLDHISFSTIIDAYGKYKEFDKMEAVLMEMQNEGFKGCVEAYNSMLDAYGKSGHIGKMENVLERMRRSGCDPNLSTFNTLINVYGKEGLILELQDVLKQMEEAGMRPDRYTYNTLIHAYGNAEMPDESMKSFREMQDAGFAPDRITYISLISAFQKSGNFLEAARWSMWMTQAGVSE